MRRHALLALALLACALLAVAEFTDLYSVRVITVTVKTGTVGSHHGFALLIVAVGAALLAFAAHRSGSRAAAAGLLALGAVALLVVLTIDLPVIDETGIYGRDFERATARAEIGFRLESAGAVLLLLAGMATLVLGESRADYQR